MKGSNVPTEMYFWLIVAIIGFVLTMVLLGRYSSSIQKLIF